jgi:hypothetical protein
MQTNFALPSRIIFWRKEEVTFDRDDEDTPVAGLEAAGIGAAAAPAERAPSLSSKDIKQNREKTFPSLLCIQSLPYSTIVHPNVKVPY